MLNNREYSKSKEFKKLCVAAGVEATKRQASKFRKGTGTAFAMVKKRNQKVAK